MGVTGGGVLDEPLRLTLDRGRRYDLWVLNVGLACCAVEFVAATMGPGAPHAVVASGGEPVDVLVISGTVTDAMAPAILRRYAELPRRPYVISFGACANCGGPYWDSYVVTKGIDQLIPVDVYVPGCPPRPEALLHGIARLEETLAAGAPPRSPRDAASLTAPLVRAPGA